MLLLLLLLCAHAMRFLLFRCFSAHCNPSRSSGTEENAWHLRRAAATREQSTQMVEEAREEHNDACDAVPEEDRPEPAEPYMPPYLTIEVAIKHSPLPDALERVR